MSLKFNTKCYGINIENPIEYKNSNKKDERFSVYNKIIPHPDLFFSLVTIIQVIHHVEEDFELFFKEACRVCNGYIYIKDVNLRTETEKDIFELQHKIFEDAEDNNFYMNREMTANKIIDEFKKNNFTLISANYTNNFSGTFTAIFKRN